MEAKGRKWGAPSLHRAPEKGRRSTSRNLEERRLEQGHLLRASFPKARSMLPADREIFFGRISVFLSSLGGEGGGRRPWGKGGPKALGGGDGPKALHPWGEGSWEQYQMLYLVAADQLDPQKRSLW